MQLKNLGIIAVTAFMAGACTDSRLVSNVSGMKPASGGAGQYLHKQYIDLAKSEHGETDTYDTGIFARRAEAAAKGDDVLPFNVWDRDFTAKQRDVLLTERARLFDAIYEGGREKFPELAATAQTRFDCWAQELEENYQPDDIRRCRDGYMAAIADLEEKLKPKPVAKMPEPPKPAPAPAPKPAPVPQIVRDYLLFFDFDSASLTDGAKAIVNAAAEASRKGKVSRIEATGHADRAGADRYNLTLSERRAEAVKAELVRQGIPARNIVIRFEGERQPLVQTADGIREPQNRRVEIILK